MRKALFAIIIVIFSFLVISDTYGQGASFYLSPKKGNYEIGEVFSVNVFINSQTVFNAARATIKFPPEKIEVIDISKNNSIFTIWFQEPVFSNRNGEISFLGGLLSPGYKGEAGNIIIITFKTKSEGQASLIFEEEAISANDPEGTNIFSFSQGASFVVSTDLQPPHSFEVIVDNENDKTNPQPLLYFETRDDVSGMSHYEIKIGEEDFFRVALNETMPYRLSFLSPDVHQILVRAFDRAENYTDSYVEIKVEAIPVPEINVCPKSYHAGEEIFYVAGTAIPECVVAVFLKKDGKIIKIWEVSSDEKGEWFLKEDGLFKPGSYKVSAKTKDVRGAISDFSKERIVEIFFGGFVFGRWIIDYKTLTVIALVPFFIILLAVFYLLRKIKKKQSIINWEVNDLKQKFYKEYEELSRDIEKELEFLRKIRRGRKITEEEKKREADLIKNLADIQEVFEKELKDIEDIK